jgi:hypothetical protein
MVEFGLWLPIVLLALCSCMQLMATLYDDRAAADAARVARAAQVAGDDPTEAARTALAGRADSAQVTIVGDQVKVTLPVRQFMPWLPEAFMSVSATAGGS